MRRLLSYVRRAVDDYHMIPEGARVAVGISGGKDSLLLLTALKGLSRFHPSGFSLVGITVDMGFPGMDFAPVRAFCEAEEIPYDIVETRIGDVVFDVREETNPCSLCAKMRRGALHDRAKALGCSHVALGHHRDDAVETFLMSLIFEGRMHCYRPVTWLSRREVTVIRPLLYLPESEAEALARALRLPVVASTCPMDGKSRREEVKQLLETLSERFPDIEGNI
ncbi:tRNA 2-thiocytidine(32) synthetase TtcA, partial [Oscillospiraceae bacterium OttesenSCG-928-F05]|nr:tRNA 2-thiocytidine(32) synthetase TtcA [Oscillospiraceae bacterium OttesenSCG-928-F05]